MDSLKSEYNRLYYERNKQKILNRQHLRYNINKTFCGSCGQSYSICSMDKHITTARHLNNEKAALFNPYSGFPHRSDLYIRKLII